jgi:hypothetical protein
MAKNMEQLTRALMEIEANCEKFKENALTLNRASNKSDGLSRTVDIIESINRR